MTTGVEPDDDDAVGYGLWEHDRNSIHWWYTDPRPLAVERSRKNINALTPIPDTDSLGKTLMLWHRFPSRKNINALTPIPLTPIPFNPQASIPACMKYRTQAHIKCLKRPESQMAVRYHLLFSLSIGGKIFWKYGCLKLVCFIAGITFPLPVQWKTKYTCSA